MSVRLLVLVTVLAGTPVVAAGQWRHDQMWHGSYSVTQADIPPTHWIEGATIGAAIFGTTGAFAGYMIGCEFADDRSSCSPGPIIAAGIVGGLTGGIVGALVGGQIPASRERPLRGRPGKAAAIGAAIGTAWGFGLLLQGCANGCHTEEVVLGLSTTTAGALAGVLVGR